MSKWILVSRILLPGLFVSLFYYVKYRCIISPKAEVDLSKNLAIGKKSQISSFTKIKASRGKVEIGERVDVSVGCFLGGSENGLYI